MGGTYMLYGATNELTVELLVRKNKIEFAKTFVLEVPNQSLYTLPFHDQLLQVVQHYPLPW